MKDIPMTEPQQDAAQKMFAWLDVSSAALQDDEQVDGQPEGIALPPHERGCGRAHPIRGTNHEDLNEWCARHEC